MALIGYPDKDYTIRGTRKETSYINKYPEVDGMRDSLHMPMGAVTIYILCDMFVHFKLFATQVCFALESLFNIFPVQG